MGHNNGWRAVRVVYIFGDTEVKTCLGHVVDMVNIRAGEEEESMPRKKGTNGGEKKRESEMTKSILFSLQTAGCSLLRTYIVLKHFQ